MNEVYQLSDRVSVLRDGEYIGTLNRDEISPDKIVRMIVGRELSTFYKKAHQTQPGPGPVILSVRDMSDGKRVTKCSLEVHRGEVLGIAGLVGAGRTELARIIYGVDRRASGTIELLGSKKEIRSASDAIEAGILYLTPNKMSIGNIPNAWSVEKKDDLGIVSNGGGVCGHKQRKSQAKASLESGKCGGGNRNYIFLSQRS
jgi:ribose transport system ATP-binding protein